MLAPGAITDIAGISVGHATVEGRPTGCSVVLCPQGMVCGAAVRGGAPGTRETDLLRPENTVERVHAVLLSGGSAFGLDAAGGVMRWLDEHGHGLQVGPSRVPIVPAAVLFDLWLGDPTIRPAAQTGYAACVAAATTAPAQGNHGAGLGATVGKLFGIERAMKGGIGSASLTLGAFTVGALVAVNAIGDVLDDDGRVIAGARDAATGRRLVGSTAAMLAGDGPPRTNAAMAGIATTIGVLATNAMLTKAQATQLANLAHHGLARCVNPITPNDGDAFFVLASGAAGRSGDMTALGALAAGAVACAVRNAVRSATALRHPPLPAAADLPSSSAPGPGR